jgi:hypothetical protein
LSQVRELLINVSVQAEEFDSDKIIEVGIEETP